MTDALRRWQIRDHAGAVLGQLWAMDQTAAGFRWRADPAAAAPAPADLTKAVLQMLVDGPRAIRVPEPAGQVAGSWFRALPDHGPDLLDNIPALMDQQLDLQAIALD